MQRTCVMLPREGRGDNAPASAREALEQAHLGAVRMGKDASQSVSTAETSSVTRKPGFYGRFFTCPTEPMGQCTNVYIIRLSQKYMNITLSLRKRFPYPSRVHPPNQTIEARHTSKEALCAATTTPVRLVERSRPKYIDRVSNPRQAVQKPTALTNKTGATTSECFSTMNGNPHS